MKYILTTLLLMASTAFADQLVQNQGYVKIAETGTYKGMYVFAKSLDRVRVGIESPNALPEDVELLDLCSWVDFGPNGPDAITVALNKASIDEALIDVTYWDNGHPLAGMCVQTVEVAK